LTFSSRINGDVHCVVVHYLQQSSIVFVLLHAGSLYTSHVQVSVLVNRSRIAAIALSSTSFFKDIQARMRCEMPFELFFRCETRCRVRPHEERLIVSPCKRTSQSSLRSRIHLHAICYKTYRSRLLREFSFGLKQAKQTLSIPLDPDGTLYASKFTVRES
jgi:hypothetical protein